MKVNIDIDDKYKETSITIQANQWPEELEEFIQVLQKRKPKRLFGMEHDQTVLLEPGDIDYIYAENRKVFAALPNRSI
ncbi:hypothetical protein [Paucisalibacillus sp. EB02]|uniref:hypothetical protein n=1 Tax=Paucisalibacillus sp. EB02 TaxID=1347087 RepID=UPI0004AEC434|nr:hypothetical protein [Paucisalibacillus sp. EB02]